MAVTGSNPSLAAITEGVNILSSVTWAIDHASDVGTLQPVVRQVRIADFPWRVAEGIITAAAGQSVMVRQIGFNEDRVGGAFTSSSVTVSAPAQPLSFTSGPEITGTIATGETVTLSYTYDGSEPVTASIRWTVAGEVVDGETSASITLPTIADEDAVFAEVALENAAGSTGWVSSNVLTAPLSGDTVIDLGDGFSITVEGQVTYMVHADGPVRIISDTPVNIISKTPEPTGTGSALRNGWVKNPRLIQDGIYHLHGYDGRRPNFSEALVETSTVTLDVNDVLVGTESAVSAPDVRSGYTNRAVMVYVAATSGVAGTVAPFMVWHTGRTDYNSPVPVDYMAKAAELPTEYGVTGVSYPDIDDVRLALRFNPFYGQRQHTIGSNGYESYFPSAWANYQDFNATVRNYGRYVSNGLNEMSMALMAPLSDVPLTVKAEILMRMDSFAQQSRGAFRSANISIYDDGAHQNFMQVCCIVSDWMRGIEPDITRVEGNWRQPFYITSQLVSEESSGFGDPDVITDTSTYPDSPWAFHWTRVASVDGSGRAYITTWRNSTGLGHNRYPKWLNGVLVRQSDGQERTIIAENDGAFLIPVGTGTTKWVQPETAFDPPLQAGDSVRIKTRDGLVEGDADWKIVRVYKNAWDPTAEARYRDQQRWGCLMLVRALGVMTPSMLPAWDYFIRANAAGEPANDNYPGMFEGPTLVPAVYTDHIATITSVAQPYLA